jgi:hypothetical protein
LSTPIDHTNAITTDSLASLPLFSSAAPETESISVTSESIRMLEEDIGTDITDLDDFEIDTLGQFSSSVERHMHLCQALVKLDTKMRDEAEQMLLDASEKASNAKMRLEASRKEAAEIHERLRCQASSNGVSIQLPWAGNGGGDMLLARDYISMVPDVSPDSPVIM